MGLVHLGHCTGFVPPVISRSTTHMVIAAALLLISPVIAALPQTKEIAEEQSPSTQITSVSNLPDVTASIADVATVPASSATQPYPTANSAELEGVSANLENSSSRSLIRVPDKSDKTNRAILPEPLPS